jgi:signal transduction histidine kinase
MESATVEVETDRLIRGNPDRVLELFIRLFENSVEHTDGDVTITVDTIDERGFYVEDDGTGIPDDEKADVFDIGYGTGEGEGFGIPIVQGMANAHEWEVELTDSEAGGVRFEFRNVVID